MPKNIILCADGTGNKGGSTPDSNVYKIYKSVNKYFKGTVQDGIDINEQIVFYDNGVGTEKNKYLRMIGGGFGLGFEDNVCDLYKFLSKNYDPGDRVYFFGFSRGASTVRACNGFISTCGLIKGKGLRNHQLDKLVKEAFAAYKIHKKQPEIANKLKISDHSHNVIDIHFMGVWDTVVALGFPKRTDIIGPVSAILNGIFLLTEEVLDKIWPHSFYCYDLTINVKHAYQALAINDERTAFWPHVWREKGREQESVEQVWFAGMHSNVGGGYPRSGMASVPLHWMMLRAEKNGLKFEDDAIQKVLDDSHIHGRMYNSRDGFGAFYRYHPRKIAKLCSGRVEGHIQLHRSVIERLNHRTANYSPGQLPGQFVVVESDIEAQPEFRNPDSQPMWSKIRNEIDQWVLRRKGLYATMLTFTLASIFAAFNLRGFQSSSEKSEGLWRGIADFIDRLLPDFFDGLINFAVAQNPIVFISSAVLVCVYIWIRRWCRIRTVAACEGLRHLVIIEEIQSNT